MQVHTVLIPCEFNAQVTLESSEVFHFIFHAQLLLNAWDPRHTIADQKKIIHIEEKDDDGRSLYEIVKIRIHLTLNPSEVA